MEVAWLPKFHSSMFERRPAGVDARQLPPRMLRTLVPFLALEPAGVEARDAVPDARARFSASFAIQATATCAGSPVVAAAALAARSPLMPVKAAGTQVRVMPRRRPRSVLCQVGQPANSPRPSSEGGQGQGHMST